MCIRDRRRWEDWAAGRGPARATADFSQGWSSSTCAAAARPVGGRAVAGFTPVSYTHLTLPTICSV
eukprot:6864590-Alexandrium_andersonii.AAC.1